MCLCSHLSTVFARASAAAALGIANQESQPANWKLQAVALARENVGWSPSSSRPTGLGLMLDYSEMGLAPQPPESPEPPQPAQLPEPSPARLPPTSWRSSPSNLAPLEGRFVGEKPHLPGTQVVAAAPLTAPVTEGTAGASQVEVSALNMNPAVPLPLPEPTPPAAARPAPMPVEASKSRNGEAASATAPPTEPALYSLPSTRDGAAATAGASPAAQADSQANPACHYAPSSIASPQPAQPAATRPDGRAPPARARFRVVGERATG